VLLFSVLLVSVELSTFFGRLAFGARIEANIAMNGSAHMKHTNGLATFEMLLQLRRNKLMEINFQKTLRSTVAIAVMTGAGTFLRSICTKAVVSASFQENSRPPNRMKVK